MWIEHPDEGLVPTYGGPFDSYTIPESDGDPNELERAYYRRRYDHDLGGWTEVEVMSFRVVSEERLIDLKAWEDSL